MSEHVGRRILVTGATGFLGEQLTRRLLADGASVRILVRSPAKASPLVERGAELAEGAITDGDAVRRAVRDVSVIYHLAGKLFISGVREDEYRRTHVEGTRTLLAAASEQSGLMRFVHCSTTGIFGTTGDVPADEDARVAPTNAYERTKFAAELLVREAGGQGLPAVVVRPGLVYGPGDLHLLGFFRSIQRGLFRPIGKRPIWLHPIYINDMTEAFVRCGDRSRAVGESFNVAGRDPVTLEQLASAIARALGVGLPQGWIPLPMARTVAVAGDLLPASLRHRAPLTRSRLDFLTHSRAYNVAKARDLLDFVAATDLDTGMACTAAWYRDSGYLPAVRSA
jgi:nucleoside-diphosphate-sugar epimerase